MANTDPKPFASLSSGLLARKGAARPAMRPQGFGQVGNGLEDLGWNDMGFEPPKPHEAPRDAEHDAFGEELEDQPRVHPTGLTPVQSPVQSLAHSPVQSPVHTQHAEIADRLGVEDSDEVSPEDEEFDETAELYEEEPAPVAIMPSEAPAADLDENFEPEPSFAAPRVSAPAPRRAPRPRSAPGTKGKAAFTLRLDKERHLKLRLACAVNGRSAQQLVTDALDQLLTGMPELEVMAEKAKRKG